MNASAPDTLRPIQLFVRIGKRLVESMIDNGHKERFAIWQIGHVIIHLISTTLV